MIKSPINSTTLNKFGDVIQLENNLWIICGDGPGDIPNVVVYRANDRMYVLDSGAGPIMRASIVKVLEKASQLESFTLLNSHGHVDHVGNNDIIGVAQAKEKHHYISNAGPTLLYPISYFTNLFLTLSNYYDPLAAYRINRFRWWLLTLVRNTAMFFAGERRGMSVGWFLYMKKFQPFHPSRETMEFFETLPKQNLTIGEVQWTGWILGNNDVWVLEERGHTPDGVLFYIPEHKLLHTGDLTFPMFPTFPDTNGKVTREMLQRCHDMASAGAISLLTTGHSLSPEVFWGKDEVVPFLGTLLTEHDRFQAVLKEILEEHDGLTVGEVYASVEQRHKDPVVRHYLAMEYPDHPMSLQQIITVNLVQMGYVAQGPKGKKRFYRSERVGQQ